MTWRRIMFAVASPGDVAPSALNKVASLARALGAQLELFSCVFEPNLVRPWRPGTGIEQDIRRIVEYRHRQLEILAKRLRTREVKVRTSVRWDDPPYEGIVRQALRHGLDLLIVQSTRRSRAARLLLTHTDHRLIATCPCPLLLIKTTRPYSEVRVVAAVDPLHAHDKPATLDEAILDAAGTLSRTLRAALHVYHACEPWSAVARGLPQLGRVAQAVQEEVHAAYCERAEARVAEIARRQRVPSRQVHLEEGRAVRSLPRFARRISADIVAMGAVSRSLPERRIIGHTAERVLDRLDSDVLIVKPVGFRSPVSRLSVHRLPKRGAQRARYVF